MDTSVSIGILGAPTTKDSVMILFFPGVGHRSRGSLFWDVGCRVEAFRVFGCMGFRDSGLSFLEFRVWGHGSVFQIRPWAAP